MSREFSVEIIRPDKSIMSKKVDEAILPCFEGEVTILKDHIPLITVLRPGILEVGKNEKYYVEEGTVEFFENKLLILSSTAINLMDFKSGKIKEMIKDAEEKFEKKETTDKQKYILSHKISTLKKIN